MPGGSAEPVYHMGHGTWKVPMKLFAENRSRLCKELKAAQGLPSKAVIVLQGGEDWPRHSSDVEVAPFRQESYFHWTFGVVEPGFFGAIDVDSGKTILFMRRLPESYRVWFGEIYDNGHFQSKYAVDEVHYVDEMPKVLKGLDPSYLLTLYGQNTDSKKFTREATFDGIKDFKVNNELLHPVITECRVFKSDLELDVIRYVCKLSSEAHKQVMKKIKPGWYEYQAESAFLNHCYFNGGTRLVCYCNICASGNNSSVLHYGHAGAPNDRQTQDGDFILLDMGSEYYCYCSDITCTYPVNGKFSPRQKVVYESVLNAQNKIKATIKPGLYWADMHRLAERTILTGLRDGGLLKGDIEDMMKVHMGAVFMPHGLGHLMGHDVHDVGGFPKGVERIDEPGLNCLRTTRKLQERMVLTIEPGCYFVDFLLDQALAKPDQAKFMVKEEIDKYRGIGGVRIEDNFVVTPDGIEVFTSVPRSVSDIEKHMAA